VCNKCGASGHSAFECTQTECSECGSTTHKRAMSFACPEHKCTDCQKGHNRNDYPRMETAICDECGETGRSANKCPIRPCSAFCLRSHNLATGHLCHDDVCILCNSEEEPTGHNKNSIYPRAECQTCKLFGHWHVAKDCAYANCLDVDADSDRLNILLASAGESIVDAYFTHQASVST
jgi:hypothetical protein